jgi:hypothetical protein
MAKRGAANISADELVALLKRSSLPTVVVEGGDDIIIFRKLEAALSKYKIDVLPAEGRSTLLEVFRRRAEIQNGQKIAFVADRDWWVCATVPAEFISPELIFTDGYSIENDVFRDGNLYAYLDAGERAQFDRDVNQVVQCFALGISRILNAQTGLISFHPNEILDNAARCAALLQLAVGEAYPAQLRDQILADYPKLLRGKSLMGVLMRQLSRAGRMARHNPRGLMEVIGNNRGPLLSSMFNRVEQIFA